MSLLHNQYFVRGQGVPQSYAKAVKWFCMAADQGHARAKAMLGFMYESGLGVPQNYKIAYIWYALSAANATGELHKYVAELRDQIAKKLSLKQLEQAQQTASEWKPKQKMKE